ncbi:histidine kinase [Pseudomonas sp. sp1636]|uniref:ATP-binding protein n=1 Tax=Pseudomonas sp. sp1636 TaxID=3036707 RepID=UPI0025A4D555|nr:ATP-binding protein [Pseudomonas sp. sp1636]MDM8349982.1 histidine kinase [Pseudomonas sp. sp1636]
MLRWMRSSLPVRAGMAVTLIAILALGSSLSAGLIAWFSEDDAGAINTAGSLRMATYRLNWQLEAGAPADVIATLRDDLQVRLNSDSLQHRISSSPDDPLHNTYLELHRLWQEQLRPALDRGDKLAFQQHTDNFATQLEYFVLLLQKQSERRQGWQQSIQGAALLITVIILLVGMYELQLNVITPLQELVGVAERFRSGDHGARVEFRSEDELGQMALSFNAMAETIEESHRTLESRVAQKTQTLAQTNAALELLYQSSRSMATRQANAERLDELISRFQQRLPGLRLTLCLQDNIQAPAEQLLALHGSESREVCARSDCATCEHKINPSQATFSISNQGNDLGELKAYFRDGHRPQPWETALIQALANQVGTALSLKRQREQEHRLLLLDERTIIARELHDSLAQALSYMKLQVSRLQTLIRRGEKAETLETVSGELRDGLNTAYRQLRELLTTFRLQIQDGGLDQELKDTVQEFAKRGDFSIELQIDRLAFQLSASEQIHLLQITREALSNCARHAQAKHAWLRLRQIGEQVELSIEDDGCGFTLGFDPRQHHGLTIMQERARSLHGQLHIETRAPQGTRIHLQFRPEFLGRHEEGSAA